MRNNRSIPRATVIPEVAYPDVRAAAGWLCTAFGFTTRLRIGGHRIQLNVGDGALVVTELQGPEPATQTHSVLIRLEDVDAHCARAKKHGATILREPADHPYGERQYAAVDPFGRQWRFSQTIADVAPESWGGEPVAL